MRGRQFGFIGILCATWVTARVGIITMASLGAGNRNISAPNIVLETPKTGISNPAAVSPATGERHVFPIARSALQPAKHPDTKLAVQKPPFNVALSPMSRASETFGFAGDAQLASGASAAQQTKSEKRQSSLEVYAYSFWRSGAQAQAPLGSGQYGGSQSAVIAALPLLRFRSGNTAPKLAFIGRAAVAHGNSKEREIAAGLRWRPLQHLPLHLTAERRFRHARADAVAVYLAGGKSGIGLPLGFKLDSYGQTGFVSGKGGGAFADFNARADRQILKSGKAAMAGGAGIWGGGQAEVMRVDIGPTVRADIAAGAAQFRLTADWRFRVAGSARPGDGPAITLSTSF